ncbi:predicted protein [Postia placenta Mad-698-R]|nr:predicted protein [Postia placenta Mad-698-R]
MYEQRRQNVTAGRAKSAPLFGKSIFRINYMLRSRICRLTDIGLCRSGLYFPLYLWHYRLETDQAPVYAQARELDDRDVVSVFSRARIYLILNAVALLIGLLCCPLSTWMLVACILVPALLWNTPLFNWPALTSRGEAKHAFVLKRVPVMKAVFVGVIRGTWDPVRLMVWSTINWTCMSITHDMRDFEDDKVARIPTIPVLLDSVYRARVLITAVQLAVLMACSNDLYIVSCSLWIITLAPRWLFICISHAHTPIFLVYGLVQWHKWVYGMAAQ